MTTKGTSTALEREVHKWLGSEVDWALPWIGLKPSPLAALSTGVQSWLTVSLFDHCSLPVLALALRRGRLPSLSAFTNCFTSFDSAWLAPGPSPALASCRLGTPNLLLFFPDFLSLKGPCLKEEQSHVRFTFMTHIYIV